MYSLCVIATQGRNEKKRISMCSRSVTHYPAPLSLACNLLARLSTITICRKFAGMLAAVDEGIGNVSKASERLQMASTTLWVVVSDNGGPSDDQCGDSWVTPTHLHGVDRNVASNYPLRGKKNTVWCVTTNKHVHSCTIRRLRTSPPPFQPLW